MTVDFPTYIDDSAKIVRNGETFEVTWIVEQPYERLIGLKKCFANYES